MFFELTDLLTCPRCGPTHGLVLLVREVEDRRVLSGWLGCPSCRHDYPVTDGAADLRLDREAAPTRRPPLEEEELALKIVALSRMAEERGYLLVDGRLAHAAPEVSELALQLEVIAVRDAPDGSCERAGVSRVLADVPFPLAEHRLRCVAIAPAGDRALVTAAVRRVAVGGRLLLFDARASDIEEAESSGITILAAQGGTAVGERKFDSLPIVR